MEKLDKITPDRINKVQASLGLTIPQFAMIVGVSQNTFANWKYGTREVPELYNAVFLSMERLVQKKGANELIALITTFGTLALIGFLIHELGNEIDTEPQRKKRKAIKFKTRRTDV
jgi:transcriptional regulator with XRE-family HTH domain